jgi:SAM-dependent methyltransferase
MSGTEYRRLHSRFAQIHDRLQYAAGRILEIVERHLKVASALDVGCGAGDFLFQARKRGVADVFGIEGEWADGSPFLLEPDRRRLCDLEQPFDLGRKYDLVITLEVAEHLSARAAGGFVESVTRHGDFVLFSAAIPHQGGINHVNEQWPAYWAAQFAARGFGCHDFIRWEIWEDELLPFYYRQNLFLYARKTAVEQGDGRIVAPFPPSPKLVPVVHPTLYRKKVKAALDAEARQTPTGTFRA